MIPDRFRTIAFVSTGLGFGGADAQLVQLAHNLKARGWSVHLISMVPPILFAEELVTLGIPVHSLGMKAGRPDPRALVQLAALIRSIRPGIMHSHMIHANLLSRVSRLLYWVPVCISTIHSIDDGGRAWQLAYRCTDPFCDLTTHVSRTAVDRYVDIRAVPRAKIRHIPNGIDIERFRPRPDVRNMLRSQLGVSRRYVWLAVGRFEAPKDYGNLIDAFHLVAKVHEDSMLLLVGQGSEELSVRSRVRSHGLESRVRFLGVRQDIPELMNAADAYVLSSEREGLPLVLLEASASGLPIVATDVGGTSEVVVRDRTGFLVPPRASASLGSAMLRLVRSPSELRASMGAEGRAHVEACYALDRIVTEWEDLYRELALRKRRQNGPG